MRAIAFAATVAFVVIMLCLSLTSTATNRLMQRDSEAIATMWQSSRPTILNAVQAAQAAGATPTLPTYSYNPCGSGTCAATGKVVCSIGSGTATGTDENANITLGQKYLGVLCTATLLLGASTIASGTYHTTYALFNRQPWALEVGAMSADLHADISTNVVSGEGSGIGCNPASPATCQTITDSSLTASSLYTDTRPHVVPSCAPNEDPAECSGAGSSIPSNVWGTQQWTTTQQ